MKALSLKIMLLSIFIILVPVAHINSMQNNGKEDRIDIVFGSDEASMSTTRETAEKSPTLRMMLANLEEGENSLFLPLPDLSPNTIESIAAVLQGDRSINEIRQQYESDPAQLESFNNVLQYLAISEDPIIAQEESPDIPQTLSEPIIKAQEAQLQDMPSGQDLSEQDLAKSWANVLLTKMSEQQEKAGETYLPKNVIENILGYAYKMPRDLELWLQVLLKTKLPFSPNIHVIDPNPLKKSWLDKDRKYVVDTKGNTWQAKDWQQVFNLRKRLPSYYLGQDELFLANAALSPGGTFLIYSKTGSSKAASLLNKNFNGSLIEGERPIVFNAEDTQVAMLKKSKDPKSYKGYTYTVHNIDSEDKGSLSEPLLDIIDDVKNLQPNANFNPQKSNLVISPENNYAILQDSGAGILIIYQMSGGNWTPIDPHLYANMHGFTVEPMNKRILLYNDDHTSLIIIDTETWQAVSTINANSSLVNLQLSRNGAYVIGETHDNVLHIYDADTAQEVTSFANITNWKLTKSRTDNPEVIVGISGLHTLFVYDLSKQEKIINREIESSESQRKALEMVQFNGIIILSLNSNDISVKKSIPSLLAIFLEQNKVINLPIELEDFNAKNGLVSVYQLNDNKFILRIQRASIGSYFGVTKGSETSYFIDIQPSLFLKELWRSLNQEQHDLIYALFNHQQKFGSIAKLSINKKQQTIFYSLPQKLQNMLYNFVKTPMNKKI